MPKSQIIRFRPNDCNKPQSFHKPLFKSFSLFKRTNAHSYGGSTTYGSYSKLNKAKNEKIFYISNHNQSEYFGYEILLRVGINTPKCRFILDSGIEKNLMATNCIENYIPMLAVRHDIDINSLGSNFKSNRKLHDLRKQYKIDITSQVIIDLITHQEYKISGNLFASDIAAILVEDEDFQPDLCNIGLVKMGNRFFAFAIDKEKAKFSGDDYHKIVKQVKLTVLDDALYETRLDEQVIAILFEIDQALMPDSSTLCDFDKIFLNPRLKITNLSFDANKSLNNLKLTAKSILDHYKKIFGHDYFDLYFSREKIRTKIAENVIKNLDLRSSSINADLLLMIIVEDLRAPYYRQFFTDRDKFIIDERDLRNTKLINAITNSIMDEFNLSFCEKLESSSSLSNQNSFQNDI